MEATKKEMSWFYVFIEAPLILFLARQPLTKPPPPQWWSNLSAATLSIHGRPVTLWMCPHFKAAHMELANNKTQQQCVDTALMSLQYWSITHIFRLLLAHPLCRITASWMCPNSDSNWNRSLHSRKARQTHYLTYRYIFQTRLCHFKTI